MEVPDMVYLRHDYQSERLLQPFCPILLWSLTGSLLPSLEHFQSFREIEIFGIPTDTVVTDVSIAGKDSVLLDSTISLTATITGINVTQTVFWSSSNPAVATVDSTGVVTGVALGTATIAATSTQDNNQLATKEITVLTPVVDSVRIAEDDSIWLGYTGQLSATVFGTTLDKTVTWSSSNPSVATVDSITGEVRGVSIGTATIKATSTFDDTKTDSTTITITPANIALRADITTTVPRFFNGDIATNIARLRDGVKDATADDVNTLLIHPSDADGKTLTFAWPGKLYYAGQFIFYNRGETRFHSRIDTSTVAFFHGENRVYIDTILNAGATVTITPNDTIQFNKVVLTFSGGAQNFREIEIFGTPTPVTVDRVSIAGDYSIWVGHTALFSATVTGINASQTVFWSSSDENVATVDSITGEVRGVAEGTVTITSTSASDNTKTASKIIVIILEPPNIAPSAEITTTATEFFEHSARGATGNVDSNIAVLIDGEKASDNLGDLFLAEPNANGKTLTFAWPNNLYYTGRFVFYNRQDSPYHERILGKYGGILPWGFQCPFRHHF